MLAEIKVAVINNPLDLSDIARYSFMSDGLATVKDVVTLYGDSRELVVSVNGEILQDEDGSLRTLQADDCVVMCPVPQGGGGGGKSVLRLVAILAVAVFAPMAVGALGTAIGGFGAGASLFTPGVIAAMKIGFTIGGMMVANALIPVEPAIPASPSLEDTSTSYGIDGAKSTQQEGLSVPVIYGTYRVSGNIVSLYTQNVVDAEGQSTQDVMMALTISEGVIDGIDTSSILLNDQPIANFGTSVDVAVSTGHPTQPMLPYMNRVISPTSVGATLTTNWTTRTTTSGVDRVRIDVVATQGWRTIDNQGNSQPLTQLISIEYRKQGTTTWTVMPSAGVQTGYNTTYTYTRDSDCRLLPSPLSYTTLKYGTVRPNDTIEKLETHGRVGDREYVTVGYVKRTPIYQNTVHEIKGMYTSAYRASFESPILPYGVYEIRVKRQTAENTSQQVIDTLVWSDLNQIQEESITYNNTAMIVLKMRLSDQMTGIPNVSAIVRGRVLRAYGVEDSGQLFAKDSFTANPAWIVLDMLTNSRYAGKLPLEQIDIEKFYEWSVFCKSNKLEFNGVFDGDSQNLWDSLQYVLRVGRAKLINVGNKFSVAVDMPAAPVMMFNVTNIVEKSLSINWLPMSDRINELEVTFYDKANDYNQNTLRIVDETAQSRSTRNVQSINLIGVTDKAQAVAEATLYLNMNRLLLQTVTFSAPLESIACTIGDVILIQHDVPQWGFGGRLDTGSTATLAKLDRDVTLESGKSYKLLLRHDVATVGSGNVESIAGQRYIVLPTAYSSAYKPTHIKVSGEEFKITSASTSGGKSLITVDRPCYYANNSPYILYQIDFIDERTVTSNPGTRTELAINSGTVPATGTVWLFGETTKVKKPFRILSIRGDSDALTREITAIEYNDLVYSDTIQSVSGGSWTSIPTVGQVIDLSATQIQRIVGGIAKPVVRVEWNKANDNYRGADIFARITNGNWQQVGNVGHTERVFEYSDVTPYTIVSIKVVAIDQIGSRAPFASAPTVSIAVTDGAPVSDSGALTITTSKFNVIVRWSVPDLKTYKATEIAYTAGATFTSQASLGLFTGMSATHALQQGNAPYYWARRVNTDGQAGAWTTTGVRAPLPANPQSLALVGAFIGTEFTVQWLDQDDATRYEVVIKEGTTTRRTETVNTNRYTYTKAQAVADGATGRSFIVNVRAVNVCGFFSVGSATVTATNDPPPLPNNLDVSGGYEIMSVNFDPPSDPDFENVRVWIGETSNFVRDNTTLIAALKGGPIAISGLVTGKTYYVRVASYDAWGEGTLSGLYTVTMSTLPIPSLSAWATKVDPIDAQFIEDHVDDDSIVSTKIANLTAAKLTAGTINAVIGIGSTGIIQHYSNSNSYRVTVGPVAIPGSTNGVSMFSFLNGTNPIVAFYEDGTAVFKGKIIVQNGSTGYNYLTDRPTSLAGINSTEGTKLTGIQAGATVGATWGTNISGQPTSLAGINSAEGSKLTGIQAGATVGAVWNSNITGQPANSDILNYDEGANTFIDRPAGGAYRNGAATITGAIKIRLPQLWSNTMLRFNVDIFNYVANKSFSVEIAGYNYTSGWQRITAKVIGAFGYAVRYGHDGVRACIWIGDTSSSWSYLSVRIYNLMVSHLNYTAAEWKSGWEISVVTAFDTVGALVEADSSLINAADTLKVNGVPAALILSQLADAQATADGKIQAFYQSTTPLDGSEGDIWFHTGQGNKIYTFKSGAWVVAQDTGIAQAIGAAQTAQTTADGKAYVFYSSTQPTTGTEGDLWYKTSTSKLYRRKATNVWDLVSTVGATWGTDLSAIPVRFSDAATEGLNLTASYMGFYTGGSWRSYMNNSGHFYLNSGAANNYLAWNGTTLTVKGDVEASSVKANISLSAPAIVGGSVTSATLNSAVINSPVINAGTLLSPVIRTSDIEVRTAGGELLLSSGGLGFGVGINLLGNTDFVNNSVAGWNLGWNPNGATLDPLMTERTRAPSNATWTPPTGDALVVRQAGYCTSNAVLGANGRVIAVDIYPNGWYETPEARITVTPNARYEFTVIAGVHRCYLQLGVVWFNRAGAWIGENNTYELANDWLDTTRRGLLAVAPATAAWCNLYFRKTNTTSSNDSYVWIHQPYFGQAGAAQAAFSPYSPGTRGGALSYVSQINSANRPSTIAAGTFGAFADVNTLTEGNMGSYVAPQAITGTYIKDLTVDTLKIGYNAVTIPIIAKHNTAFVPSVNIGLNAWSGASIALRVIFNNDQPTNMPVWIIATAFTESTSGGGYYSVLNITHNALAYYGAGGVPVWGPPEELARSYNEVNNNSFSADFSISAAVELGPGPHIIDLRVHLEGSVINPIHRRARMIIIGAKR